MKDLIRRLCEKDGAPGSEKQIRDLIEAEIQGYVHDSFIDSTGNLIIFKKGKNSGKNRLMLFAHMDEVALRVRSVNEDGTIKCAAAGNIDYTALPGSIMRSNNGVRAAAVFPEGCDTGKKTIADNIVLDCGTKSKNATLSKISIGDFFVFDTDFTDFPNGLICAKALENRIGCAILIDLIKSELPYDAWFVFSSCGETIDGLASGRGAKVAAERICPDIALNVNCRAIADFPSIPAHKQQAKLGGGAIIPLSDYGAGYYRPLRNLLETSASASGISWQNLTSRGALSDAKGVYTAGTGVRLAAVAVPLRYIFTGHSIASLSDICAARDIAKLFISEAGDFDA